MRIAVLGATGRIGSRIVSEARGRGHGVTAVVRDRSRLVGPADRAVEADVFDSAAVARAVAGADVVVTAVGDLGRFADQQFYVRAARSVVAALRTIDPAPRLIAVGGFGGTLAADGQQYADRPNLPADAVPEITGQRDALTYLRGIDDPRWTYLSPPPGGVTLDEGTGTYQLTRDTIGAREVRSTMISADDYAIALVDEVECGEHVRSCVVVAAPAAG